jgi:hypothetical protein
VPSNRRMFSSVGERKKSIYSLKLFKYEKGILLIIRRRKRNEEEEEEKRYL